MGCNTNNEGLDLNLQIKGLKKGEIIIKKLNDSAFVSLDSFQVNGNNKINFKYILTEPEMIFLDLNLNDGSETKTTNFFAENSKIDIETSLENYGFNMSIKGSINDSIYRDYISLNINTLLYNIIYIKPSVGIEPTTLRLLSVCSNQMS